MDSYNSGPYSGVERRGRKSMSDALSTTQRLELKATTWWNKTPIPALLGAVFVLSLLPVMPDIEGRYFPVMDDTIVEVSTLVDDGTAVVVRFNKIRTCEIEGMSVFVRDRSNTYIRVPWNDIIYTDDTNEGVLSKGVRTRPLGVNSYTMVVDTRLPVGMWKIYVRHSCHPFWDTRTLFWP